MQYYYYIKLVLTGSTDRLSEIEFLALKEYSSTGIEEFSIEEDLVDEILGERSYSGADIPTSVIEEVEHKVNFRNKDARKIYFASKEHAKDFLTYLSEEKNCFLQLVELPLEDWNETWRESYKPIIVASNFEVIPAWERDTYKSSTDHKLFIYPGMGFGTGSHETTFLCLKLMLELSDLSSNLSCLDFGCGSGILALGLKKLYQNCTIDLYDIDQEALDNCIQNIELNEFTMEGIKLLLPKNREEIDKKYNLVFANILKNVLEFEKDFLIGAVHSGGSLILSGLLKEQEEDIVNQYLSFNNSLELVKVERSGDWIAILFKKK